MGVDRTEVSRIESGKRKPNRKILELYGQIFEMDFSNPYQKERMPVHAIRISDALIDELVLRFSDKGDDLSSIVRNVLNDLVNQQNINASIDMILNLIDKAVIKKSEQEISLYTNISINLEYLKTVLMQLLATQLELSDQDKARLEKEFMRAATNNFYSKVEH